MKLFYRKFSSCCTFKTMATFCSKPDTPAMEHENQHTNIPLYCSNSFHMVFLCVFVLRIRIPYHCCGSIRIHTSRPRYHWQTMERIWNDSSEHVAHMWSLVSRLRTNQSEIGLHGTYWAAWFNYEPNLLHFQTGGGHCPKKIWGWGGGTTSPPPPEYAPVTEATSLLTD